MVTCPNDNLLLSQGNNTAIKVPMTNEEDSIYTGASSDGLIQNNAGQHLMLNVKEDDQGYVGTFNVGVNATRSIE